MDDEGTQVNMDDGGIQVNMDDKSSSHFSLYCSSWD